MRREMLGEAARRGIQVETGLDGAQAESLPEVRCPMKAKLVVQAG